MDRHPWRVELTAVTPNGPCRVIMITNDLSSIIMNNPSFDEKLIIPWEEVMCGEQDTTFFCVQRKSATSSSKWSRRYNTVSV